MRSHFGTSSWGGTRYAPMAFTEHGVLMLSSVLSSEKAIDVNIHLMRVFTRLRQILKESLNFRIELENIKRKIENQDKNIELVFSYFEELMEKNEKDSNRRRIGFKIGTENKE